MTYRAHARGLRRDRMRLYARCMRIARRSLVRAKALPRSALYLTENLSPTTLRRHAMPDPNEPYAGAGDATPAPSPEPQASPAPPPTLDELIADAKAKALVLAQAKERARMADQAYRAAKEASRLAEEAKVVAEVDAFEASRRLVDAFACELVGPRTR